MRTRILGGVGVMSLALALSGCDCQTQGCNGPFTAGIATAGVSTAAPVVVLIRPAFSPAVFVDTTPTIDIRIAASTTVDLDQVTIHMIDGTNLGGPMVTVPRTDLVSQFGNTRIVAGTTRTFTLSPTLVVSNSARSVVANVTVMDTRGVAFGVTAESAWH